MESAGTDLHVIWLLDQAALIGPVGAEIEDNLLEIH